MELERRAFLSTAGLLVAGALVPLPMSSRLSPSTLDLLHRHAQSLAQRIHASPPMTILGEARSHLRDIETLLLTASGWQRTRLHRAAALTALVAVRASRFAGARDTTALIGLADRYARDANDGPLLAQALFYRARHSGEANYAVDAGTIAGQRLLIAALWEAGRRTEQGMLRSLIRYELAWEHAALGDTRGACLELHAADAEHDLASRDPDLVDVADGRPWAHAARGAALRRLGLHDEAITACSTALVGPPLWQTAAMVDIARSHAAQADVDAAAAALEDAFLLNVRAGLEQRQGRVRAVRAILPDTPAVRQLDAVMDG